MTPLATKIKICGLTNAIDAQDAIDAGATDLGFVMGGSVLPQEIEPRAQHIREAIPHLDPLVHTHLVTHLFRADDIADLADYLGVYGIQVSEPIPVTELARLRAITSCPIIKTIPTMHPDWLKFLELYSPYADEILVDSSSRGYTGGTGLLNDLHRAGQVVALSPLPVWLAGGLTPENVADSLRTTYAPYADVSTGVSCFSLSYPRKDRKDPAKMRAFVTNATSPL